MSKKDRRSKMRSDWIADTQMFQRVAGVPVTSDEELGAEFDSFDGKRAVREAEGARTNRIIQDAARKAGQERRS